MATWPASGNTDWNTKMLAYLAVEHNTDGTHAIKWPINGTGTKIYTKYLTGTLDADSSTSVAHGVTEANILAISVICYDDALSAYRVSELFNATAATIGFYVTYSAANITIANVGSVLQGNAYRIKIDYTI